MHGYSDRFSQAHAVSFLECLLLVLVAVAIRRVFTDETREDLKLSS